MIYLKKFLNHQDYESYITGTEAVLPNVSLCETKVHYNPYVIKERLVAKFNVTSTTEATKIISVSSNISSIEIDGVEQPSVTTGYTFDTTGEHTVKYTLTDDTKIANGTFGSCYCLVNINIPDSVTTIGSGVFQNCSGLTSINIPYSVTNIGDSAFEKCSGLVSINIPDSVTSIGISAFAICSGLTSVTIGNSVTTIGNLAFAGCRGLLGVTIYVTTPPTLGGDVFYENALGRRIYVPSASVDAYKAASGWSEYASYILQIP